MVTNLTLERMEGQIKWYSEKSTWNQEWFKKLKVAEIVAAALVPFCCRHKRACCSYGSSGRNSSGA